VSKNHKLVLLSLIAQYLKFLAKSDDSTLPTLKSFLKSKEGLSQHIQTFEKSDDFESFINKFETCWNKKIEFNPTASVVSAIMSQEIIKVITMKDHPAHGFFIYDSES